MKKFDLFLVIFLNLIWSSAFAFSGYAMKFFSPIFLYGARFLFIGLLLLPFSKFPRKDIFKILILSTLQTFCFYGIALGIKYTDSSITAILSRLDVIFSILLGVIFLNEKVRWNTFFGVFLCFVAIYIISNGFRIGNINYIVLIVLSSVFSAVANVFIKVIRNTKTFDITISSSLIMGIELLIISHIFEAEKIIKTPNLNAILSFLYLAFISTFLGYFILYKLLKKYDISKVMPYNFIRPIFSIFMGYLILGESITLNKILGVVLINIGILISEGRFKKAIR